MIELEEVKDIFNSENLNLMKMCFAISWYWKDYHQVEMEPEEILQNAPGFRSNGELYAIFEQYEYAKKYFELKFNNQPSCSTKS